MINIAYVVSTLKRSGPTNQLYSLIKYLEYNHIKPSVITLSAEPADSRLLDFKALEVGVYSLGLNRLQSFVQGRRKLRTLLEQLNIDLLQGQGLRADVLTSKLNETWPTISTLHNYPQLDYPMTYGKFKGKIMAWRHMKSLEMIDYCVGVSKAVCKNAEDYYSVGEMIPIQNGVDTDFFYQPDKELKTSLRKKLNIPLGAVIWVSSGHLSERKNPVFIIDAWKKHFGQNRNHHLVFLGSGPLEQACKKAVAGVKNIHLVGRVTEVLDHIQASDYFISSSRAEGLPIAVLEAMACGLPVLLSDISPHREVWEFNRKSGILFEVDSETSFLEGLKLLSESDYEIRSDNAVRTIKDCFNARNMSKRYQELYKTIVSSRREYA